MFVEEHDTVNHTLDPIPSIALSGRLWAEENKNYVKPPDTREFPTDRRDVLPTGRG